MRLMATRAVPSLMPNSPQERTSTMVGSSGGRTPRRVDASTDRVVSRGSSSGIHGTEEVGATATAAA